MMIAEESGSLVAREQSLRGFKNSIDPRNSTANGTVVPDFRLPSRAEPIPGPRSQMGEGLAPDGPIFGFPIGIQTPVPAPGGRAEISTYREGDFKLLIGAGKPHQPEVPFEAG